MTWGFSRDDVESSFFSRYLEHGIFQVSPFESLDVDGRRPAGAPRRAARPRRPTPTCTSASAASTAATRRRSTSSTRSGSTTSPARRSGCRSRGSRPAARPWAARPTRRASPLVVARVTDRTCRDTPSVVTPCRPSGSARRASRGASVRRRRARCSAREPKNPREHLGRHRQELARCRSPATGAPRARPRFCGEVRRHVDLPGDLVLGRAERVAVVHRRVGVEVANSHVHAGAARRPRSSRDIVGAVHRRLEQPRRTRGQRRRARCTRWCTLTWSGWP